MSLPSLRGSSADASDPIETASLDELRALQLARLKQALAAIEREVVEIPCVVGGQRVHTGKIRELFLEILDRERK